MTEQEALAKSDPEWALIKSLYAMLERNHRTIEMLTAETSADKLAAAFDRGFTDCAYEHIKQGKDPQYPITRVNPYKENN